MGSGRMGWRGACGVLALPWNANGQKLQDPGDFGRGELEGDLGRGRRVQQGVRRLCKVLIEQLSGSSGAGESSRPSWRAVHTGA